MDKLIPTFMALARTRNFSSAACQINQAQSTISKRVRLLEERVGFPLFVRKKGSKSITLTPEGESFVPIAERWLSLHDELTEFSAPAKTCQLRVGGTDSINWTYLKEVYHKLLASEPGIHISMQVFFFKDMYPAVAERKVEAAFSFYQHDYPSVQAQIIYTEPMVLLRRANAPEWCDTPTPVSSLDLSQEIYIPWVDSLLFWRKLHLGPACIPRMTVFPVSMITEFMTTSGMWSIVPQSFAVEVVKRLPAFVSPLLPEPPQRTCYYLTHKNPTAGASQGVAALQATLFPVLDALFGKKRDGKSHRVAMLKKSLRQL